MTMFSRVRGMRVLKSHELPQNSKWPPFRSFFASLLFWHQKQRCESFNIFHSWGGVEVSYEVIICFIHATKLNFRARLVQNWATFAPPLPLLINLSLHVIVRFIYYHEFWGHSNITWRFVEQFLPPRPRWLIFVYRTLLETHTALFSSCRPAPPPPNELVSKT